MISSLCSDVWLEILSFIPLGNRRRECKIRVKEIINLERICSEVYGKLDSQVVFYLIANKLVKESASEFWINYMVSFQLLQSIELECLKKEIKKKYDREEMMKVFKDFRGDIDWKQVVKMILNESYVKSYVVRLTATLLARTHHCGFFLRNLSCGFVKTRTEMDLPKFQENLKEFNQDFILGFLNPVIESMSNYKFLDISPSDEIVNEFDYTEITADERFRRRLLDWWFNIGRGCFKELRQCLKRKIFGNYQELKLIGTIQNSNVKSDYPTYHFKVSCILIMNNSFLITLLIPRWEGV